MIIDDERMEPRREKEEEIKDPKRGRLGVGGG